MHAENFIVDQSGNRHAVKHVLELLPQANRESILAFVVKTVNAVNLSTLVVATQKEEVFLEFDLVRQQ